jgi:hypothetical protein
MQKRSLRPSPRSSVFRVGVLKVALSSSKQTTFRSRPSIPVGAAERKHQTGTPNADYRRLDYRITVTDPFKFTRPFDLTRYFVWKSEMTVASYNCLERKWNLRSDRSSAGRYLLDHWSRF